MLLDGRLVTGARDGSVRFWVLPPIPHAGKSAGAPAVGGTVATIECDEAIYHYVELGTPHVQIVMVV